MHRRKSIKALLIGTVSAGVLIESCNSSGTKEQKTEEEQLPATDRMQEEIQHDQALAAGRFFTDHELAIVALLTDIIIPADEISGSATEAKVPAFIDFMMRDKPEYQVPMRGGLRWLDLYCLKQFEKSFTDCTEQQRLKIVDEIAYPQHVKPAFRQGANFFSLMRNLTISGFYTSEIGVKDIGFKGNQPNQWNGVPDDILKQYNLSYTEKELKECISYDKE